MGVVRSSDVADDGASRHVGAEVGLIRRKMGLIGRAIYGGRRGPLREALRPLSVMALVAEGELRKVSKVLAASGSLDPTTIPAEKRVIF